MGIRFKPTENASNIVTPVTRKATLFVSNSQIYTKDERGAIRRIVETNNNPDSQIVISGTTELDFSGPTVQHISINSDTGVSLSNPQINKTVLLVASSSVEGATLHFPTGSNNDGPAYFVGSTTYDSTALEKNYITFTCIDETRPIYIGKVYQEFTGVSVTITTDGMVAWFDADSAYVTLDGSSVDQWTDRHNGYTITNTGSFRPVYTQNAVNGKNALTFNELEYLKAESGGLANLITGSMDLTVFCVHRLDGAVSGGDTLLHWYHTDDPANYEIRYGFGLSEEFFITIEGDTNSNSFSAPTETVSEFHIKTVQFTNNGETKYHKLDGNYTLVDEAGTIATGLKSDRFELGHRGGSTAEYDGEISELIIYNRALTDEEVESVEDYLFNKYFSVHNFEGLTAFYQFNSGSSVEAS